MGIFVRGQTLYVNPATSGALYAHSAAIDNGLSRTDNNLTPIQRGQLTITGR